MKIFCRSVIGLAFAASIFFANSSFAQLAPGPGELYPYVVSGSKIVVHRDEFGGLPVSKLFSRRVSTSGVLLSIDDEKDQRLPARFEVKVETGSYNGTSVYACASGWRPPTYRETLLIFLLKDELSISVTEGYSATKTKGPQGQTLVVYWDANEIESWEMDPSRHGHTFRICIRDIDTSSLGLSDL